MAIGRRQYPFDLIEPKWQAFWDREQTFRAWNPGETLPAAHPFARRHHLEDKKPSATELPPKYYILDMFPYPSGAGLHVGHPEGYTATDILARYRRALGFNVLHPMGWDAFGLPAEQYAIKTGQHPRQTTEENIATFKRQIKSLGFSYDWSREVDTTDPKYFKWTQWIFLKLYNSWFNPETNKAEPLETLTYPPEISGEWERRQFRDSRRLAYNAELPVWWCNELGTVLANEEVVDGKSDVGGFPVVRKPMRQWVLRITAYAERLLADLDIIDWTDSLKKQQTDWIGRSEGAEVDFEIADCPRLSKPNRHIRVFTTRPDTLFGATYMVLTPEHMLVSLITSDSQRPSVTAYQREVASKSDRERIDETKGKTGVFIGAYAINPVSGEDIPIWVADYVLASYGTGAIMAVPAHDERDFEFATKFNLPIVQVVQPTDPKADWRGFVDEGISVNSAGPEISITGLPTADAKKKITDWLEANGLGRRTTNYKLRDWLFSRQRYWGEPFPLIWKRDSKDGSLYHEALPENSLPLQPPELADYKPTPGDKPQPPLGRAQDWANLPDGSTRELNTMPQWAGSCWYYLRFLAAQNAQAFTDAAAERYWMGGQNLVAANVSSLKSSDQSTLTRAATPGVDLYVGGTEHAVLHLLYARFWHKVLYDLGYASTPEPFFKLVNQGMVLGEDNQKMSKSRGNVIPVDVPVAEVGTDALRLYEMFMGPLEMVKPWSTKGVEGVYRFLGRVWRLFVDEASETEFEQALTTESSKGVELLTRIRLSPAAKDAQPTPAQLKTLHACLKKVTEDLEGMKFNTAISALMVFTNDATGWEQRPLSVLRTFLQLLAPFAPHLAEELWALLHGRSGMVPSLTYEPWPKHDPAILVENTVEIPIQVNGKVRDRLTVPVGTPQAELEALALASDKVKPYLTGKSVKKVIVIPNKLVNIAVG